MGQAAKMMFSMKNGDQQRTKVKKTKPSTLVAFCSVATALADKLLRLLRLFRKLHKERKRVSGKERERETDKIKGYRNTN